MKFSTPIITSIISILIASTETVSAATCSTDTVTVQETTRIPFPTSVAEHEYSATSFTASTASNEFATSTEPTTSSTSTEPTTSSTSTKKTALSTSTEPTTSSTSTKETTSSTSTKKTTLSTSTEPTTSSTSTKETTLSTSTEPTTSSTSTEPTTSSTSTKETTLSTSTEPTTSSTSSTSTTSSTSSTSTTSSTPTSSTSTTSSTSATSATATFDFAETYLAKQNYFRSLMEDTPPLTWNDHIAEEAQNSANEYTCDGSTPATGNTYQGTVLGENLAYGYNFKDAGAVIAWFNEITKYNYDDPKYSASTGHFTQLVWANTTEVGCGFKQCGEEYGAYIICDYFVGGNEIVAGIDTPYIEFNMNVHEPIDDSTKSGFSIPKRD